LAIPEVDHEWKVVTEKIS